MKYCPGCGGRVASGVGTCPWCHRPLVASAALPSRRGGRDDRPSWAVSIGVIGGLLVVLALGLLLLAGVLAPQSAAPGASSATPTAIPTAEGGPTPSVAGSGGEPKPRYASIANTGGHGTYLRQEPSQLAVGIAAWPEGTTVLLLGPEVTAEGRTWYQVEDPLKQRGWMPADYLASSTATATATTRATP